MRKLRIFALCALLLMVLSISALAKGEFSTAEELCRSWGNDYDYPDYICGVYATGDIVGDMTFVLTQDAAGEAGKAKILAQVADHSTVSFAYDKYSYGQLMEVMDGIDAGEAVAAGAMAWGPGEYNPDTGEYTARVGMRIDMSNPAAAAYMNKLAEQFGDKIYFEDGTGKTIKTTIATVTPKTGLPPLAGQVEHITGSWLRPVIAALAVLAIFFFWHAHTLKVCQTTCGQTVTAARPPTVAETEAAVRESHFAPSEDLDRRILAEIDKM